MESKNKLGDYVSFFHAYPGKRIELIVDLYSHVADKDKVLAKKLLNQLLKILLIK
jgi:hypothetical protein